MTMIIVEVEWLDACCEEGPMPLDAILDMEANYALKLGKKVYYSVEELKQ